MPKEKSPVTAKNTSKPYEKKESVFQKKKYDDEEIDSYLNLKTWQLNKEVLRRALIEAFPLLEERLQAIEVLTVLQETKLKIYKSIKNGMPNDRKHHKYKQISEWNEKVFQGSSNGANLDKCTLEEFEETFNEELNNEEEEKE